MTEYATQEVLVPNTTILRSLYEALNGRQALSFSKILTEVAGQLTQEDIDGLRKRADQTLGVTGSELVDRILTTRQTV